MNTKRLNLYSLTLLLGLLTYSAITNANPCNEGFDDTYYGNENEGFGGTGHGDENEGFGGTGHTNTEGFGGTGIHAKIKNSTNIVGVITGFASICVNGAQAHFGNNT